MEEPQRNEQHQEVPAATSSLASPPVDGPSTPPVSASHLVVEENQEDDDVSVNIEGNSDGHRHDQERERGHPSSAVSYRLNMSTAAANQIRDDVWSCFAVLIAFWFFASLTIILGYYGSVSLELGPNCSRLVQPNPLFVQSLNAGEDLHKEWVLFLNKGSKVDISYCIKSPGASPLSLVIARGPESLIEWIDDPSYPNTTFVMEYHKWKCEGGAEGTTTAVLTAPGPTEGVSNEDWYVKLSYSPRWIIYIIGSGVMTALLLLALRLCNWCRPSGRDGYQAGEIQYERTPLISQKDDDSSSWGSSYDSNSHEEEDLEKWLAVNCLEGKSVAEGENLRRLCVICFDALRDCFFLPCGHCAACFTCGTRIAEEVGACPICRRSLKKVRKIFTV
ncbi:hypothetical protein OIU76_020481 [Salix suchowensis]|nr:hypothetical protein OIU76_020481 [Salix suchowensis]